MSYKILDMATGLERGRKTNVHEAKILASILYTLEGSPVSFNYCHATGGYVVVRDQLVVADILPTD